jgi:hypothetical protein
VKSFEVKITTDDDEYYGILEFSNHRVSIFPDDMETRSGLVYTEGHIHGYGENSVTGKGLFFKVRCHSAPYKNFFANTDCWQLSPVA